MGGVRSIVGFSASQLMMLTAFVGLLCAGLGWVVGCRGFAGPLVT